jgi:hypothetical protein
MGLIHFIWALNTSLPISDGGGIEDQNALWESGEDILWDDDNNVVWDNPGNLVWILANGIWNDSGLWDDNSVWID